MKILALSLLRVGDLIQQRPLLQRLRDLYPTAEIHVLANTEMLSAQVLFPEVNRWFAFDRKGLQAQIGTAEIPLTRPLQALSEFVDDFEGEQYDLLLNFTHNRLSAYLAEAIPAQVKKGLVADGRGFRRFENSWLTHFNERFSTKDRSPFHYVELLSGAFDLGEIQVPVLKSQGHRILLQPLTSDSKKNYPLLAWQQILQKLRDANPSKDVRVLGAPFEKQELTSFFADEDLLICEWHELTDYFGETSLLITGDTSVKHLAAQARVPILEIALGSADPAKTGVFAQGGWVVQAKVDCAPCVHQSPCRKTSHLCGESLPASEIIRLAQSLIQGDDPVSVKAPLHLYRTSSASGLGWSLSEQGLFEKAVWKLTLEGERIPRVGSVARDLLVFNRGLFSGVQIQSLLLDQGELENLLFLKQKKFRELAALCFGGALETRHLQTFRQEISAVLPLRAQSRDYFWELEDALTQSFSSPLQLFGYLKQRFERISHRIEMRRKLIRQLMEDTRGTMSGNKAERGLEAP